MYDVEQLNTTEDTRAFLQVGGPGYGNARDFAGLGGQFFRVQGLSGRNATGSSETQYFFKPRGRGYMPVAEMSGPPEDNAVSLQFMEYTRGVPRQLTEQGCPLNIYIVGGKCADASDLYAGAGGYVHILSKVKIVGNTDMGDRVTLDSSAILMNTVPGKPQHVYPAGTLAFGPKDTAALTREVVDAVFGDQVQCGDCGIENDGTRWQYMLVQANSGSAAAFVRYSVDGGATWATSAIAGIVNTELVTAIEVVGNNLVVVSSSAGGATTSGYYYATINPLTGIPSGWTKVTTGFVATKVVRDVYVAAPNKVYLAGDGGYVYRITDLAAGAVVVEAGNATTANLLRIGGTGNTIVAVGASDDVSYSLNDGATWTANSGITSSGGSLTGVAVMSDRLWWVLGTSGDLFVTKNQGATWTTVSLPGSITSGQDIVAATAEVIWIAGTIAGTTGYLWLTLDGGNTWRRSDNAPARIASGSLTTATDRLNRIAIPRTNNPATDANSVLAVGLDGGATLGYAFYGTVQVI